MGAFILKFRNQLACKPWIYWYQSKGNRLNFLFLHVLHAENKFPVQDSGLTLDKKIEEMTIFKAYLRLVKLAYLVKSVPHNKVRTFIFKNMYGLL